MRSKLTIAAFFLASLTMLLGARQTMAQANPEIRVQPLYSCVLNRSQTLQISQLEESTQVRILLEVKHFTGVIDEKLEVRPTELIRYGNKFLFSANKGRSGYFFLRAQDGLDLSSSNTGSVLIHIDNSLFGQENSALFTQGRLAVLPNCNKLYE